MAWLTLTLPTDAGNAQALADLLTEAGALAVTLREGAGPPVLEPGPGETPLWSATRVEGLFPDREPAPLLAWLRARAPGGVLDGAELGRVEERDWVRETTRGFQPLRFGQRLWVCPTWTAPPAPAAVTLRLDPGLAFGTGTHPTTALCLDWLAAAALEGTTVVDYGAGSGILAVAALLLGAADGWAVDHDPQALRASADNAALNGVGSRLRVVPPESLPALQVDLVVANVLAGPLVELAERLTHLLRPGGTLVLSGILSEQAQGLAAAYAPHLPLAVDAEREGWCRLVGCRVGGG